MMVKRIAFLLSLLKSLDFKEEQEVKCYETKVKIGRSAHV